MKSAPPDDFRKQTILEAASKILSEYGYEGATIRLIAAEAGVSRGLLHYYFKNKEEMLGQVIKKNTEIGTKKIADVLGHHYQTPEDYAAGLAGLFRDLVADAKVFYIYLEGFILAKRSTVLKTEVADSYVNWKQAVEIGLNKAREKQTITPDLSGKELAALIVALTDGLGLQFLAEPKLVNDNFIWKSFEGCIVDLLRGG
jgi:AcrR family transcriptional regulator